MKILDIGCGKHKYHTSGTTTIGLDIINYECVDVVHDLEKLPLPFENEEFDMVYASHILEHIHNIKGLMKELIRVLKSEGILYIIAPHHTNPQSKHYDHRSYWSSLSFSEPIHQHFDVEGVHLNLIQPFKFLSHFFSKLKYVYEWRFCYVFPSKDIIFILRCKK